MIIRRFIRDRMISFSNVRVEDLEMEVTKVCVEKYRELQCEARTNTIDNLYVFMCVLHRLRFYF